MSEDRGFFAELLGFARDHWLWWVIPIGLLLLLILVAALAGNGGESGFEYSIF